MFHDYSHPSKVSCLPLVLSFFFVQSQPSKKLCGDEESLSDLSLCISNQRYLKINIITVSAHVYSCSYAASVIAISGASLKHSYGSDQEPLGRICSLICN